MKLVLLALLFGITNASEVKPADETVMLDGKLVKRSSLTNPEPYKAPVADKPPEKPKCVQ